MALHLSAGYLVTVMFVLKAVLSTDAKEYCHNEKFIAQCATDEVVLMTSAVYGRLRGSRCMKTEFGFVDCSKDVLTHTHRRCSGRKFCSIPVPDAGLDESRPCDADLKSYLEAAYVCQKVISAPVHSCNISISPDSYPYAGYISSRILEETKSCGTDISPLVLSVQAGQLINLTFQDFSTLDNNYQNSLTGLCHSKVTVEENFTKSTPLCFEGTPKSIGSYLSKGSALQLVFDSHDSSLNVLMEYRVIGCPDLPLLEGTWMRREQTDMMMGCESFNIKWKLSCNRNTWEGSIKNCSLVMLNDARRDSGMPYLSIGASILIILGVSLAIGIVVLVFGLCHMKRKRRHSSISRNLAMRDMKPLSSEASYDVGSLYARNSAFQPMKVSKGKTTGTGPPVAGHNNEYEYVWDVPGGLLPGNSNADRPDIVKVDPLKNRSCTKPERKLADTVCTCACVSPNLNSRTMPRNMTARQDGGSVKTATLNRAGYCPKLQSFHAHTQPHDHRTRTLSSSDTKRVCRHCGHVSTSGTGSSVAKQSEASRTPLVLSKHLTH